MNGEALLGKLKGHNRPITSMCVLPFLPTVITIDETLIINVWDVLGLTLLQSVITKEKVVE